jgi:hypothetical protein
MKRLTRKSVFQLESLETRRLFSALTVTNAADSGIGSLRAQIAAAQSGDSINFGAGLAGQTITLTSGEIAITRNLTIEGLGADQLAVSGNDSGRVFAIPDSTTHAEIRDLTITHGTSNGGGAILNFGVLTVSDSILSDNSAFQGGNGGAIANDGSLTVIGCTLSGNYTFSGGGGAIFNAGTLTVRGSNLSENTAFAGGAICNSLGILTISDSNLSGNHAVGARDDVGGGGAIVTSLGAVTVSNCTIADNRAIGNSYVILDDDGNVIGRRGENARGGGIFVRGAGTLFIDHSTLAGNQAIGGAGDFVAGAGYGGAICSGTVQLHDTIMAGNNADDGRDAYVSGSVTSLGHNLIGNASGATGFVASDLLNVNPLLGALQNNGGPTPTIAPLPGSPAINAGDNTNAPVYDQRGIGFPRIVGGTIDIGAIESGYAAKVWIGPASGGNWSSAACWSPAGAPNATDQVAISGNSDVNLNDSANVGSLTLSGSAKLTLEAAGNRVFRTSSLSIEGTALLDLSDNAMILDYTGELPMPALRSALVSGYAGGAWNGPGIGSSVAASALSSALGFAEASDLFTAFPASIAGQIIDATSIVVRYTSLGDATLDREVDVADLGRLASNWQQSPRRWSEGDFNFDGTVDIADLGLLATNWHTNVSSPTALARASSTNRKGTDLRVADELFGTPPRFPRIA